MLYRANDFIVTKCPDKMTPFERSVIRRELVTMPYQKIYFTRIEYLDPIATYPTEANAFDEKSEVIAMSGVGNPQPFINRVKNNFNLIENLIFDDHHSYKKSDIEMICDKLKSHPNAVIITTEKDSIKFLMSESIPKQLREKIYYTPIKMKFIVDSKIDLLKNIDYDIRQN